jgi:hypothetical protein
VDEQTTTQDTPEETAKGKQKREQSTVAFPYTDLNDGVELANVIWSNVGTSTCDQAQLAAWAGHDSVDSGAFRTRMSGARTFGLITSGSKQVALTALGRSIVDADRAAQARVDAFLNVELYRRLFERYKEGSTLPATNVALEADLVDLGVAEKQKDRARQVFQRSAEQAGFFAQGRNRLVRPAIRPREEGTPEVQDSGGGGGGGTSNLDPFIQGLVNSIPKKGAVWPVSRRKKWLQTAEGIFSLMFEDGATDASTSDPNVPQPPSGQSPADAQD